MTKPKANSIMPVKEIQVLDKQIEQLEQRCTEAEEALDAIRRGAIDALVIYSDQGEQIYTIQGADTPYRRLVEAISEGAATLIDDGTILYCNHRFAEMLASPLEEIIGTSIYDHIVPENRKLFGTLIRRGLLEECRDEIELLCKGGQHTPIMASLNSFSAFGGVGVCLIAFDLTERKKVEQLTRQNALRAETLSEYSRALVEAALDERAIMKVAINSALQLIGDACFICLLSHDEKSLKMAAHYYPEPQLEQYLKEVSSKITLRPDTGFSGRVFQSGEALLIPEVEVKKLKTAIQPELFTILKRLKLTSMMVLPIRTQHKTIGVMIMARRTKNHAYDQKDLNLSQRIANQAALAISNARLYNDLQNVLQMEQTMRQQLIQAEKLSALSRMMATVVHEINNPVQTIKNCVYLALLDTPKGSAIEEILNMAASEIDRISKLVSGLREIYRQPKTKTLETLEISKVLNDVHMLLEPHLQHKKVAWLQETGTAQIWVKATPDHLKQVFLNISLNAIEAMQPGGGRITIKTTADVDKSEIGVSIIDTGCGIEPENLDKIFDPFYTTKEEGSGLGLPICYEIVQQLSGHITVQSQPGVGSTFTVWLPSIPYADT